MTCKVGLRMAGNGVRQDWRYGPGPWHRSRQGSYAGLENRDTRMYFFNDECDFVDDDQYDIFTLTSEIQRHEPERDIIRPPGLRKSRPRKETKRIARLGG